MRLLEVDSVLWLTSLHLILLPWSVLALIPSDGTCNLSILLPFTIDLDQSSDDVASTGLFTKSRLFSLGYSQLASAVLAMNHFNARDGRVTPEVAELRDCHVQFGTNETNFLDTGTVGNYGNQLLFHVHRQLGIPPCAVAGPFNEIAARDVATFAAAAKVPQMPHRAYSVTLAVQELAPMTTNISPDHNLFAQALVSHLRRIGRDNYIAFLHSISDIGVQAAMTLRIAFQTFGINQSAEFGYVPPVFETTEIDREIPAQMQKVKDRGFRTIAISMDVFSIIELPALANAAEALNMLNGDYVFIFLPAFEKAAIHNSIQLSDLLTSRLGLPSYENVTKMLRGAALISDVERYHYRGDSDPFLRVWQEEGAETVEQINHLYTNRTIQRGKKDLLMAPNYFQAFVPEEGAGRIYDVIMALGLGACNARKDDSGIISGTSHVEGIRKSAFTGVGGRISFGDPKNNSTEFRLGTRQPGTATFGLYNLYPPSTNTTKIVNDMDRSYDEAFVLTHILSGLEGPFTSVENPVTGTWTQYGPDFVYSDGRTVPPELLRDVPEQNYLPQNLRIVGFALMGGTLLSCAISGAFVVANWNHRVLRASQPIYLCLLLFGAAVTALAILTVSFDESYGWDENALSKACVATPWLFCCGHCVTYGALFSKLWRVNKVLQFTRRRISASAVAGPLVAMLFATVAILTAWTVHDPLVWTRTEVNDVTGESFGQCDSNSMQLYVPILGVVMAIPTVLTCIMAWKTKDVDQSFTESSWIFTLIILQLQVIMVSIPIAIILRGTSTAGRYMGVVFLISSFPATTIAFIMGPKFVAYSQSLSGGSSLDSSRRSRGASQGRVVVSGISRVSGATNSQGRQSTSELESAFVERDGPRKVSFLDEKSSQGENFHTS